MTPTLALDAEPQIGDPDSLYEIIAGQKVVKEMSSYENALAGELHGFLRDYARANGLGRAVTEVMFQLPNLPNRRRPDVAFVSYSRWAQNRRLPRTAAWPVVPELAVEIVSPTDYADDVIETMEEFFRAGVTAVWVVYPAQERVYAYTSPTSVRILSRADDLAGEPVLPGFRLPLADLFPPPDPEPEPAA